MARQSALAERLLSVLAEEPARWRHGYDLMKKIGVASGTLYPLLMRLRDGGLVEAEWQAPAARGRPARHAYRITPAGLRSVAETRRTAASAAVGGAAKSPA